MHNFALQFDHNLHSTDTKIEDKTNEITNDTLHNQPCDDKCLASSDPIAFDLKYLQSMVYGAPPCPSYSNEPMIEAGDFGLSAADAEIKQSPEYIRHLKSMEAADRQLDEGIGRIMLDASLDFGMLHELETNGDPNGDNDTDILERVEQYASEFKSRLTDEQRQCFHSP